MIVKQFIRRYLQSKNNCTYFAFAGKRGNVIFAVNPASVEFQGKEGEEGAFLDHFTPVKEEIRFR